MQGHIVGHVLVDLLGQAEAKMNIVGSLLAGLRGSTEVPGCKLDG